MSSQLIHTMSLLVVIMILIVGCLFTLIAVFDKIELVDNLAPDEEVDIDDKKRTDFLLTIGIILIVLGFVLGAVFKL